MFQINSASLHPVSALQVMAILAIQRLGGREETEVDFKAAAAGGGLFQDIKQNDIDFYP